MICKSVKVTQRVNIGPIRGPREIIHAKFSLAPSKNVSPTINVQIYPKLIVKHLVKK